MSLGSYAPTYIWPKPWLEKFNKFMLKWAEKIDGKVASRSSFINLIIDQQVEASIDILNYHTLHVHRMVNVLIFKL